MEKPILFNTEMVKAILEDRKSCTRRIIKKKYSNTDIEFHEDKHGKRLIEIQNDAPKPIVHPDGSKTIHLVACEEIKKPYEVGDTLYVRETWCDIEKDFRKDDDIDLCDCKYIFKIDDNGEKHPLIEGYVKRWRPSIHMPKKAARIFLKVTGVRAERLQDITHEEILKEGTNVIKSGYDRDDYEFCWINLWEPTCTKEDYRWNNNPYVWVIEFERIEK